jgi:hypothetical protein
MTTDRRLMAGEGLEKLPHDGRRYGLLDGVLHELAPNNEVHDAVRSRAAWALTEHVVPRKRGRVMTGETGHDLRRQPDRLRARPCVPVQHNRGGRGTAPQLQGGPARPGRRDRLTGGFCGRG